MKLTSAEKYDEALACLDEILDANRDRDHEHWLARSVAAHRAMILFSAGRCADAEQAFHAEAQLGFAHPSSAMVNVIGMAQTLDALERTQEAIQCIEEGLARLGPQYPPTAFDLLSELAGLSENLGQPVDPKWQDLAEAAAKTHEVELPDWRAKGSSLGEAILGANAAFRARYEEKEAARRAAVAEKAPGQ